MTLEECLRKLADERWRSLRKGHNRLFCAYGPGLEWDNYKERNAVDFEEIRLLREYLGLTD